MVTRGAAGEGRHEGWAGEDTIDMVVVVEEAMSVCPDLMEAVSEVLVTPAGTGAIMDGCLEDDDGVNIDDMPRELNTLLAALRL